MNLSATVTVDPTQQTLTAASATIKTDSINTRNEKRDEHLRSADFFETGTFPEITFVSKKVSGSGDKYPGRGGSDNQRDYPRTDS